MYKHSSRDISNQYTLIYYYKKSGIIEYPRPLFESQGQCLGMRLSMMKYFHKDASVLLFASG